MLRFLLPVILACLVGVYHSVDPTYGNMLLGRMCEQVPKGGGEDVIGDVFVVYVDMTADLFHYGHANFLRQCREVGAARALAQGRGSAMIHLLVGVHSDADVIEFKRTPVMSMEERMKGAEQCKFVDQVIGDAPLVTDEAFFAKWKVDSVMHGDDCPDEQYSVAVKMGIYDKVPYTKGISTSNLIKRIAKANATKV